MDAVMAVASMAEKIRLVKSFPSAFIFISFILSPAFSFFVFQLCFFRLPVEKSRDLSRLKLRRSASEIPGTQKGFLHFFPSTAQFHPEGPSPDRSNKARI
jgi:hypothetical protein